MTADGHTSFPALGTGAIVSVVDPDRLPSAVRAVRGVVDRIDRACSRFRPDSELEAVNRAGGAAVAVGPLLLEAVRVALEAAALTDGDLDPTIGEAVRVLGYDRDFGTVAPDGPPVLTMRVAAGWRSVRVDEIRGTLQIPATARLDLGATAKAFAADLAAQEAAEAAGCGVLVGLGGDLAMAGEAPEDGWQVDIADSHAATLDQIEDSIVVVGGGVATSSTNVRRWQRGGRTLHHVIDPRTGLPAEPVWRTVTVAASSCLGANVASTTAIIRGERAPGWLESLGLPARLVAADGSVCIVGAWPVPVAG